MATVLLTHGQLRKTLSAVRSLGSKGVSAIVGETTSWNPSAFSKYAAASFVYPGPSAKPDDFVERLADAIKKYRVDVLFPMDEDVMGIVLNHRQLLETLCRLPIPCAESYRVASDKGETVRLASIAGVPAPAAAYPESSAPEEVLQAAAALSYPLVIKPRHSSGSRGIRVVKDEASLLAAYRRIDREYPLPILQEYIDPGPRYDVCLLYDARGEAKAEFVQKELRHFPLERGPSTLQESVHAPELLELAKKLMSKLPWYGIVEIEFMLDARDGTPKLMEINPRFWNSLELAVSCGVDFPWLLYRLAMDGDVPEVRQYRAGVRCKSLLPGDALHFMANPDRWRMDPPVWAGNRHGVKDDIWSWDDPAPAVGFLLACMRYSMDPHAWHTVFRR